MNKMLTRIEIRDFALIEEAVLTPEKGLLILTGETGAGKSILIDAIGALNGGKVARDVIRHGQDRASVEAVFSGSYACLPANLRNDLGIGSDDEAVLDELILSREIFASGKTSCRINGRLVTLSLLRDVTSFLIDIHGQHDQQAIFRTDTHLQLLDRYGSESVSAAMNDYHAAFNEYQISCRMLRELGEDPAERARQADMLTFQIKEIEAARIRSGEDVKLAGRRKIVVNAEKINLALAEAQQLLNGEQGNAILPALNKAAARLEMASAHLTELAETAVQAREALYILQSATTEVRNALESVESDPGELERLDERIDQLYKLKKKYGGSLEAVMSYRQKAADQLNALLAGEAQFEKLNKQKSILGRTLIEMGGKLSELRRQAAARLEKHIALELGDLGMKGIQFAVSFDPPEDEPGKALRSGLDKIEFLISANPGEPLKPLARIASGGEASRIMLAIKSILAEADQIPVLIFDEIDTGVSGHTAGRVANKLRQLSSGRQIFCITHLAQIAAMADQHILIEKIADQNRTKTCLKLLDPECRLAELARLLSGGTDVQAARNLAGSLLLEAETVRKNPG